ncbi:C40 family peptidase [Sphaerimonospora cavernae]|uniref:C40 family peptidase n=1 Tax=Sphaerimonospora cavernae TaxID=1740611 RepID=A0ABV6TXI3_9ACTN
MILETGLGTKAVIAGGGIVSSIALIAGLTGGAKMAETSADITKLVAAVCSSRGRPSEGTTTVVGLDREQATNARAVVDAAKVLRLPPRAAVIGVATALQESDLRNDAVGGRGTSFGIFQQRPASGWGTRTEVTDPRYAARAFFTRLIKVRGWDTMPLTKAAAIVQRPREDLRDEYAKHEPAAKKIVGLLWGSQDHDENSQPLDVSPQVLEEVRTSIQAAVALDIPREVIIADVGAHLGSHGSGMDSSGVRRKSEEIVTAAEEQLCSELGGRKGAPPASVAVGSGRGAIAVQAALGMRGVPYSFSGVPAGGAEFILHVCADQAADAEQGTSATEAVRGVHGRVVSSRCRVVANAVGFALAQTGKPYRWGATGPGSFDCSGLVMKAYAAAGVRIPRTTFEQWPFGVRVPVGQEQPGDLVFFNSGPGSSSGRPGHVGIVVGDGKMVEARCTRCGPITVASYRSGRPVVGFTRPRATASRT